MVLTKRIVQFAMGAVVFLFLTGGVAVAWDPTGREIVDVGNIGKPYYEQLLVDDCWQGALTFRQIRLPEPENATLFPVYNEAEKSNPWPDIWSRYNFGFGFPAFVYTDARWDTDRDGLSVFDIEMVTLNQEAATYYFDMVVSPQAAEYIRRMWVCPSPAEGDFEQCAYFEISNLPEAVGKICGGSKVDGQYVWVTGVRADDVLNVRGGPGTDNRIVGAVANGTIVHQISCQPSESSRWCVIETPSGMRGWVNARFLESVNPTDRPSPQ